MAVKSRLRSTSVPAATLKDAASYLLDLPEKVKPHLSLRESVEILYSDIKSALDRGYSYEDVAEILEKQDITISASTLKRYISIIHQETKAQPSRRKSSAISELLLANDSDQTTAVEEPQLESLPLKSQMPIETMDLEPSVSEETPKVKRGRKPGAKLTSGKKR